MRYLVTNIKINNNEEYDMNLPEMFSCYGKVAEIYTRTYAFHYQEVTFDFQKIEYHGYEVYSTSSYHDQSHIPDVTDATYDKYIKVKVLPMPKIAMLVEIMEHRVKDCGDPLRTQEEALEQAIFEELMEKLEVDFLITEL